jgi:PHD/YefM family antitoxin component YafN of YafNO toxin-antitoxin module
VYTIVQGYIMDFLSVREFRASSRNIWEKLSHDGKMVITNNGKPAALLLDISNEDLEETLLTLQQVKAMRLFNQMRTEAQKRGFLSKKEIEAEIRAARAGMKARKKTVKC